MSVYNAFVQANINVVKVFITKQVKANGGSVLAPYQITRGTLPSIAYAKGAGDVTSRGVASPFFEAIGHAEGNKKKRLLRE